MKVIRVQSLGIDFGELTTQTQKRVTREQTRSKVSRLWRKYEFEEAAQSCLTYLHQFLTPPALRENQGNDAYRDLAILFACGGRSTRWGNFMKASKHRIDLGDGIPLIQRTIIQFANKFPGARRLLLIGEEQLNEFKDIKHADILIRRNEADAPVGVEILEYLQAREGSRSDALWIYGDVFFTDDALDLIHRQLISDRKKVRSFGRKHGNSLLGTDYGEIFGLYASKERVETLLGWYRLALKVYTGTKMKRMTSWEVISLVSWALANDYSTPQQVVASNKSPIEVCRGLSENFQQRAFDPEIWTEINDETDDFDYPYEYLNRLAWRVDHIGDNADST